MTVNRRGLLGSLAAVAACSPVLPVGGLFGLGDRRQGVSKLEKLSSRERRVLEARVLADKPIPVEGLAAEFGICRARVRQLEARVLENMGADYQRPQIKNHIMEAEMARVVTSRVFR
jgi:hypothetical protein